MTIIPKHRDLWSGMVSDSLDAHVGVMGVPFDKAASYRKGAAFAPERIRAITPHVAPVTEEGQRLTNIQICDYGDVSPDLNWERYFAAVTELAGDVLRHSFALFLGGDHSVTIPLFKAFSHQAQGIIGVIHLDAHPDLMDNFEGHHWSHACTARRVLDDPHIEDRHLAFIGLRSWVDEELTFLEEHTNIGVYNARKVYLEKTTAVAEAVVAQLRYVDTVYLTLDIDCLDPAYAPGTGTPEAGGFSTRDLLELLRIFFANLPVRAMDIVEVSPPLDCADITSIAAIKVIYEVLGWLQGKGKG